MDKRFDPASYETKWQEFWTSRELFRCPADRDGTGKPPFCILIPPPNVTGKLHMGHALQSTLQDLLVRWKRMSGFNALWLPGTDHAGIATQLMVERQLEDEGTSRLEIGREAFLERTWQWKEEYHSNIRGQLELLGASCDWSRERFTLDDGLSVAVREAFVRLYEEGLISRGEYMVNWSPVLKTAISDLEVEMKEVHGKLYHFAYPIEGSDDELVVATTRPETMLGDMAVAYHPDDERYAHLAGAHAVLPLVGRRIELVADEHVDPEFGTGLVKVTPYHDPNDFEIAQRHGLEGIRVIGPDGKMTSEAGEAYAGLDRSEARQRVVADMEAEGRLRGIEDHVHNVGHSQRGGEPVEPMVSTQWFCDVSGMAARSLEAVESGTMRLIPSSWDKTWHHWLDEIRPWCISRQLWWGHQIPAWYTADGTCYVARSREEAAVAAGTNELTQDPDVLDTWFSSGLWPLSTLGWPEDADDLATFYPTSVLVTGFDILFFWVARMAMLSLHFTDEVPFADVHLTGLVRDAQGEKMSKTKGNTADPLDLIRKYGADALRFTLAALDSPGRDIPLDEERMAGYRSFGNKIWNATRFSLGAVEGSTVLTELPSPDGLEAPERWILSRLSRTARTVDEKFGEYRFDEACNALYHFFWGDLCDWYIELSKPSLMSEAGEAARPQTAEVLLTVLDASLRLLHPVMPHLTEELWQRLPGKDALGFESLALADYPKPSESLEDDEVERLMNVLQQLTQRVRSLRIERKLRTDRPLRLVIEKAPEDLDAFLTQQAALICRLARLDELVVGVAADEAVRERVGDVDFALEGETAALSPAELDKLRKDLAKLEGEIRGAQGRLANPKFVDNAPAEVVEGNRKRLEELEDRRDKLSVELADATTDAP